MRRDDERCQAFTKECLEERSKPLYNATLTKKLALFCTSAPYNVNNGTHQQMTTVTDDMCQR